jgi:L-ascorbate metabolism protein UlaG (beta-lactamase superfamily)
MKVTWLGQAGLAFENENVRIMVDPYLSDSLSSRGEMFKRRLPVNEELFEYSPNVILITHEHEDHLNMETLARIVKNATSPITFLAPLSCNEKLRTLGGEHNYVMLNAHSVWSEKGITFYATRAEHSDRSAVGFIIDDGRKTYYVSGDTLYNYDVLDDVLELVEDGVDVAFLPINGRGNNMHAKDAADFAYELSAKSAVPVHYGLFDDINPKSFDFEDSIILTPYETVEL